MALTSPRFKNNLRLQSAAQNSPPLKIGEIGAAVQILQEILVFLGHKLPRSTRKDGHLDGVYGLETAHAVAAFQRKTNIKKATPKGAAGYLVADGVAGKLTLETVDLLLIDHPYPPFPSKIGERYQLRLHLRSTSTAQPVEYRQFYQAQKVWDQYNIQIVLGSAECLVLSPWAEKKLETVDAAKGWDITLDQWLLHSTGSPVSRKELIAYFVDKLRPPNKAWLGLGNASHSFSRPALIVASAARTHPNTLAHEIGHVLLGRDYLPSHSRYKYNLMYSPSPLIERPMLDEEQLEQIVRSPLLSTIS